MTSHTAKGSFTVSVKPEDQNKLNGFTYGRYAVEKTFQGELEGASKFNMYTAGTDNGAGAYVAIETITGTLNGKSGTFLLMHAATRTPVTATEHHGYPRLQYWRAGRT